MSNLIVNGSVFQSLQSALAFLDDQGELIHITRKVSSKFELAAVIKNVQHTINQAVIFENVEGFKGTIAVTYAEVIEILLWPCPLILRILRTPGQPDAKK
jgi:3-polyprenyl-4-hydroxybenzoate decarboxylase